MGYAYLRTKGYIEVNAMKGRVDQMAGAITPDRFYRLGPWSGSACERELKTEYYPILVRFCISN